MREGGLEADSHARSAPTGGGYEPEVGATSLEEAVLRHLHRHGRITRRKAADLCGLSRPQASLLLRRLVDTGRIVRRGKGGGTWYALTSNQSSEAST